MKKKKKFRDSLNGKTKTKKDFFNEEYIDIFNESKNNNKPNFKLIYSNNLDFNLMKGLIISNFPSFMMIIIKKYLYHWIKVRNFEWFSKVK